MMGRRRPVRSSVARRTGRQVPPQTIPLLPDVPEEQCVRSPQAAGRRSRSKQRQEVILQVRTGFYISQQASNNVAVAGTEEEAAAARDGSMPCECAPSSAVSNAVSSSSAPINAALADTVPRPITCGHKFFPQLLAALQQARSRPRARRSEESVRCRTTISPDEVAASCPRASG